MTTQAAAETAGNEGGAPPNGVDAERQAQEERARLNGWRPQDEYRGPADKWVDAPAFLERTLSEAPLLRERNRFLGDQLAKEQREKARLAKLVDDQSALIKDNISEIVNRGRRAEVGAFERQRANIKAQITAAAKAAQPEEVDRLMGDLDALENNRPDPHAEEEKPAPRVEERRAPTVAEVEDSLSPSTKAFISRNSWFRTDAKLNGFAVLTHGENMQAGMSEDDSFASIESEVRRRFPEKFENERRSAPASVNGSSPPGNTRPNKGAKTVNDLPQEDRAVLERLKGMIKGYTDEMYLKEYKWGS